MLRLLIKKYGYEIVAGSVVFIFGSVIFYEILKEFNFSRWQSESEPFGKNYNSVRQQLGIPIVEYGWYTENTSVTRKYRRFGDSLENNPWMYQLWTEFTTNPPDGYTAYHKSKEVGRNKDEIVYESDEFLLQIKFNYLQERDSAWTAVLIKTTNGKDDYLIDQQDVTLSQADSVLALWGLSRTEK